MDEWRLESPVWPSPLFAQAAELRYRVLHEPFDVAREDDWHDEDPLSVHLVALAGEAVVGYARLLVQDAGTAAQVRQVSVDPAWERRGVGTALITALVERARDRGIARVWLNARVGAVPFYERLGFVVTSEEFRMPRTYLPHVRMELPRG